MLLRGLDALSTEDSVLNVLTQLTNLPIKAIRIGKDVLTNTSRGVCYVEMNSIVDSMFLHNQLLGMVTIFGYFLPFLLKKCLNSLRCNCLRLLKIELTFGLYSY